VSSVLVLAPSYRYLELARAVEQAGWSGGPTTALSPLVAGEPEAATWRRRGNVLRYSCDPVVWLRVLRIDVAEGLPMLPTLSLDDVALLLESNDENEQLLGIHALGVLAAKELVSRLDVLRASPSAPVAATARAVRRELEAR
jgi:hypothetical protein